MAQAFLDTLLVDFVEWAETITDCRAIVLFGSTARGAGDKYSDRDIQVIATDINNEAYLNWMHQYAPIWTSLREHNVEKPLWALMFQGGYKVHLSVHSVEDLQAMVDSGELSFDYKRGYKVLLDKDNLASQLPPVIPIKPMPPSEDEFTECIHNFIYGTSLVAKYLKRDDLWTVQWGNSIERNFLLQMIEWHTRALNPDIDTWHRGEHMREWINPDTWQRLSATFPAFDSDDGWRALFEMIALFRKLAQETAAQLGYPYSETTIINIVEYLKELHLHSAGENEQDGN